MVKNKVKIGFVIQSPTQYYHLIKPLIDNRNFIHKNIYIFYYKSSSNEINSDEVSNYNMINLANTLNISKIFKNHKLSCMIFFNPGQIYNFFLSILCHELNIKTIYCQHGLSLEFGSFDIREISRGRKLKHKFISIKKYIYYYFSILINLLILSNKWKNFGYILKRSKQFIFEYGGEDYLKYGLKEYHCNFAIVYGKFDRKYLINKNNFSPNSVHIGGYPMLPKDDTWEFSITDYILYISGGLKASNVISITNNEENFFYRKLISISNNIEKKLVIKLHPKEDIHIFQEYVKNKKNVYLVKEGNLSNLVESSEVVIGDYSTALFYPIKYKKPIILLQSDYMDRYPFDYTKYGIGIKSELNNLDKVLKNDININETSYEKFIQNYITEKKETSSDILYKLIAGNR